VPELLRTLIVDDEPHARLGLSAMLQRVPGVRVVGVCGTGFDAVEFIRAARPDLVLLDIQMPGMTGLAVAREIGAKEMPVTIFVTAYDEYAVRAFELHAADYLLKPVAPARLAAAIGRARELVTGARYRRFGRKLQELLANVDEGNGAAPGGTDGEQRFIVTLGNRTVVVPQADVHRIQAAQYYARLHTGGTSYLVRETMASLAARLDPAVFMRVHRSHIIRLSLVAAVERKREGSHVVILKNGTRLPVSRARANALVAALADRRPHGPR
jgi:two-component system LytT family response regulator